MTSIKRNKSATVPALADQFAAGDAAVTTFTNSFYSQVLQLREAFPPQDNAGFSGPSGEMDATQTSNSNCCSVVRGWSAALDISPLDRSR